MRNLSHARSLIVAVALTLGAPLAAHASALTDLLVSKVGVTKPQANGGAGSIFKLAKSQMKAKNFAKLAAVVPGMDKYLAAAPQFLPGESAAPVAGDGTAAALGALAGGGRTKGGLAAAAGGGNATAGLAAGLAGGGTASLAGDLGGGSSTAALAAAAAGGQAPSATDMLENAARNKLAESLGVQGAAPAGGAAGLAAGALGGTQLGDSLQAAEALAPAFEKLGMQPAMVAQFLPVVIEYVKSVGGGASSKLLSGALGL